MATITGTDGDDVLKGTRQDDSIDGGAGADTMRGGLQDDTYYVDDVRDVVREFAGEGYDTVYSSVDYVLRAHTEALTLRDGAHTGTGNARDNVLTGNELDNRLDGKAGHDELYGGEGNDRLNGGAGGDRMVGGSGDDFYVVDHRRDYIIELDFDEYGTHGGDDTVQSGVSYELEDHVDHLILVGNAVEGRGNWLWNSITGNARDNVLYGGEGGDTLTGGGGRDSFCFQSLEDVMAVRERITDFELGVDRLHFLEGYVWGGESNLQIDSDHIAFRYMDLDGDGSTESTMVRINEEGLGDDFYDAVLLQNCVMTGYADFVSG